MVGVGWGSLGSVVRGTGKCNVGMSMLRGTGVYVGVHCYARAPTTYLLIALAALISVCWCCSGCVEGSVNVMGRKGGNRLFPTLTLTLTFHHPEQSLLHKLHWLDHVIRVGVFSVSVSARTDLLHIK